jgi:hypothetical protein
MGILFALAGDGPCERIAPLTLIEGTALTGMRGFSAVAGLPQSIS